MRPKKPNLSNVPLDARLSDLLAMMFSPDELRRHIAQEPLCKASLHEVKWEGSTPAALFNDVVGFLGRRGVPEDAAFFQRLIDARPGHAAKIAGLSIAWGHIPERLDTPGQADAAAHVVRLLQGEVGAAIQLRNLIGEVVHTDSEVARWLMRDAEQALHHLLELDNKQVAQELACISLPFTPLLRACRRVDVKNEPNVVEVEVVDPAHSDFAIAGLVGAVATIHGKGTGVDSGSRFGRPAALDAPGVRPTADAYAEALAIELAASLRVEVGDASDERLEQLVRGALQAQQKRPRFKRRFRYLDDGFDELIGEVARRFPELWVVRRRMPQEAHRLKELGAIATLLADLFD